MPAADSAALQPLQNVLRQLRDIKGVREARLGTFRLRDQEFAQFQVENSVVHAMLKKAGGSGFDRFPLSTPPEQRRFVDEARLRAKRLDED